MGIKIPIEISARHLHLSQKDLECLFGKGYQLTKKRELSQPGEFAANETVEVRFNDKKISKVRVVGPVRPKTQLELSLTDAYNLGLEVPIRKSGNLKGTPGILLIGPKGKLNLKQGVICAWRHIHLNPKEAKKLKVKNGEMVSVKVGGKRSITFHNVEIRVGENYKLCCHLDTDEGNAAGIIKKGVGVLIK